MPAKRQRRSGRTKAKLSSELLLIYPDPQAKGSIRLTYGDLRRLVHPGKVKTAENYLLNDMLVDYYVQLLIGERLDEETKKRVHIFNSFFLKRLRSSLIGKHDSELKSLMKWVQVGPLARPVAARFAALHRAVLACARHVPCLRASRAVLARVTFMHRPLPRRTSTSLRKI